MLTCIEITLIISYTTYVVGDGSTYSNAYFEINYIKVFSTSTSSASTLGASQSNTTTTAAASAASAASASDSGTAKTIRVISWSGAFTLAALVGLTMV